LLSENNASVRPAVRLKFGVKTAIVSLVERIQGASILRGILQMILVVAPNHACLPRSHHVNPPGAESLNQSFAHSVFVNVKAKIHEFFREA
jgi:hypothetical protein